MDRGATLELLAGFGALAYFLVSQEAGATVAAWSPDVTFDPWPTSMPDAPPPAEAWPLDAKIAAFLATIRQYESGDRYNVINGGATFSDYSRHPNRVVPPGTSTAAGAYQIVYGTWQQFAPAAGVRDFSPASQDAVAYQILLSTGAIASLDADDLAGAISRAGRVQWKSLRDNSQVALADTYNTNLAFA